jgi:hypothetical protein
MNNEYALEAKGEFLWRDKARERIQSRVSRSADEASLGKERRFTGTLNSEISDRSQVSPPSGERRIISKRAWAAELPGVELNCRPAGEGKVPRCPAVVSGGRNDKDGDGEAAEEGGREVGPSGGRERGSC